jgi:hypothetical protein
METHTQLNARSAGRRCNPLDLVPQVLAVLFVAATILCSWLAPQDTAAGQQIDAGLKRALISFATARTLNALISVAQGTEVAVEPAGVGLVFTPGQLLDPLNDLVEQFSNLMLAASVAFGVQKILVGIGAHWLASSVLSLAALGWLIFVVRRRTVPAWLARLFVVLLMVRFAVPLVTLGSDLLFEKFMADDYRASQQAIDLTSSEFAQLSPSGTVAESRGGTIERFRGWWSQNIDVKARFENLVRTAEQSAEHLVRLMVIFLLQTLLMPLFLLWGMYRLACGAVRRAPST